ncbi:MAG: hypothetical protein P8J32_06080, partial [bacterium]|nr:hypothetical protein [bacterium]
YVSLYCDNEFMEVSRMMGKVKYMPMVIVEHQHWAWGYGGMDTLYQKNEGPIQTDMKNFHKRQKIGFELEKATQ